MIGVGKFSDYSLVIGLHYWTPEMSQFDAPKKGYKLARSVYPSMMVATPPYS